ncbi:unnamed protein product [Linum tenue]|uniref:Growth-regulating factor n=1 Tax=Linum tenue TaxID=586396 RepID=A0AAV0PRT2_9ROSI|nr:unnamed protein product [Linum tenue]
MLSNARAGNRSSSSCSSSPFTATQWQELEHQALIYKYMVSGVPIPPELLFSVKRSLDSSFSSILIKLRPFFWCGVIVAVGWGCFQVGFGKKGDPEPGRCRRTDGKKWRCSKEAYPGSKYCDRHMHRGKNRSSSCSKTTPTPTPNLFMDSLSSSHPTSDKDYRYLLYLNIINTTFFVKSKNLVYLLNVFIGSFPTTHSTEYST